MTHRLITIVSIALTLACASIPARQKAVQALATVEQVLGRFQDAEMRICNTGLYDSLSPAARMTTRLPVCEGVNATTAQLTTEKHRAISAQLADAFALQEKAGAVLLAWRTGQPAPAELTDLLTKAQSFLDIVRSLATTDQQKALVSLGATVMVEIQKIIDAIRAGDDAIAVPSHGLMIHTAQNGGR